MEMYAGERIMWKAVTTVMSALYTNWTEEILKPVVATKHEKYGKTRVHQDLLRQIEVRGEMQ